MSARSEVERQNRRRAARRSPPERAPARSRYRAVDGAETRFQTQGSRHDSSGRSGPPTGIAAGPLIASILKCRPPPRSARWPARRLRRCSRRSLQATPSRRHPRPRRSTWRSRPRRRTCRSSASTENRSHDGPFERRHGSAVPDRVRRTDPQHILPHHEFRAALRYRQTLASTGAKMGQDPLQNMIVYGTWSVVSLRSGSPGSETRRQRAQHPDRAGAGAREIDVPLKPQWDRCGASGVTCRMTVLLTFGRLRSRRIASSTLQPTD